MSTLEKQLKAYANTERKKAKEWFFKTGEGEYGEGDIFMGVSAPDIRSVVKGFIGTTLSEIERGLHSPVHEVRLASVLVLVEKSNLARKEGNTKEQKSILRLYLKNKKWVNNWDIVDSSAPYILGQAILDELAHERMLDSLSRSELMWDRRIAIVATSMLIREGRFDATMRIAKRLLGNKEDLMHKAVGWMLREVWKKDPDLVEDFLINNYKKVPRTTLRYAIERMQEAKRKKFLRGDF